MSLENLVKAYEDVTENWPEYKEKYCIDYANAHWEAIDFFTNNKEICDSYYTNEAEISRLYICVCSCWSVSLQTNAEEIKEGDGLFQMIFDAYMSNICNTSISIYRLAYDGFDFSALVLVRSLLEQFLAFFNVLIDKCKRSVILADIENEYKVWKDHFRYKQMLNVFIEYIKKFNIRTVDAEKLREAFEMLYKETSSYVHNNFWRTMSASKIGSGNDDDDRLLSNLWGTRVSRTQKVLDRMNFIMEAFLSVIQKIIYNNPDLEIEKKYIKRDENKNFWCDGLFYLRMALTYHLGITNGRQE